MSSPLRIIFMGTAPLACASLQALATSSAFSVVAVVTQPDRPKGRDLQLQPSAVKELALKLNLPVLQPERARDHQVLEQLRALTADLMVVAAYGQILPQAMLDLPTFGCLNVHTSLLPRYRGAAPIQWAILDDLPETGVTIMKMDAGLDTGDILLPRETAIVHDGATADTAGTLQDRLAALGGGLVVEALTLAERGELRPCKQPLDGVTYAHKVDKVHAQVDWASSALQSERRVRAFDPAPGAWTGLDGVLVKLWRAEVASGPGDPDVPCGSVVSVGSAGIDVACGEGVLRLTELQRSGGKRLGAGDFLRGMPVCRGMRFGSPA